MIRSIPQFEALAEEWDALAATCRSPLLDHDWFLSCAEAFHADGDLRIFVSRRGGRLVGVAPLVAERSSGGRVAQLGASTLYEPTDWPCEAPDAASDLVTEALALGQPLILQRLPAESAVVAALRARSWREAATVVRATAPSLAVPTTEPWEAYYASLSGQITSNLPRLRRKAEAALGPMTIERLAPAPAEVDDLLESFISIEGSGWKGRGGSALSSRDDLRQFFRRYAHRAARRGRLEFARLSFGSHLAAAELSVDAYGRMWQLKIGYHDAARKYYPGLHLTAASIRSAFERGLDAYEFLGSAAPWEAQWRTEVRSYQTVAAYPTTIAGLAGACRDMLGVLSRRVSRGVARS